MISSDETGPPPRPISLDPVHRRLVNVGVLLLLGVAGAYLLGRMVAPFLTGLGSALVLAVLAYGPYRRLRAGIGHDTLAALVGTALLFLLVFVPFVALSIVLFDSLQGSADVLIDQVERFFAPEGQGGRWVERFGGWIGRDGSALEHLRAQIDSAGSFLAGRTMGILSGVSGVVIQIGVALFALFYLLRDGDSLLTATQRVIPLDGDLTDQLVARAGEIIHATMFGTVAVGIAQGTLGGLLFWLVGIPGAVLWGSVMGLLGLLPVIGTPVVWGPAAVILLVQGEVVRALVVLGAGALIVSTVDNVLRAWVVSDRAQLHPLAVFVGALGGIVLFGFVGIFLGPLFFVLAVSLLEVMRAVLEPDAAADG